MVLPTYGEIRDYEDSPPAATSPKGRDVRPFLKWTAELGYNNHELLEDDCWCCDASSLLLKVMSGKKIAYCLPPVNAEVFPLLSLRTQPQTCSSGSPWYKDARVTAGQRDGYPPFLTDLLVLFFNDGAVARFEVWKISAKFSGGKNSGLQWRPKEEQKLLRKRMKLQFKERSKVKEL